MKLTKRSDIRSLTFLLTLVYFASYVTRINYGTVMVEFIAAENVAKTAASLLTTASFFTYGAGQLLSGVLGDRFSPRMLIFYGFSASILCNILLPFCSPNIPVMTVVWGINGLAQAFMWPPIVKILSAALTDNDYSGAVAKICFGSAGGTLAVYLFCPIIISASNWKTVFWVSAGVGIAVSVLWLVCSKKILKDVDVLSVGTKKAEAAAADSPLLRIMKILLPVILVSIMLQGMLRDGISTWVPTYVSETFNLGSEISILISVVLPIFHLICTMFTYYVYKALKNNVFVAILLFFGGVSIALVVFRLFGSINIISSVALLAIVNGFTHCVNALQTCYIPVCYKDSGKVSTYAGILNFATYMGSALSTYLFAKLSETVGWNGTIISWVIIACLGTALTLVCYFPTRKKI